MKKKILALVVPSLMVIEHAQAVVVVEDESMKIEIKGRITAEFGQSTTIDDSDKANAAEQRRETKEVGGDFYSRLGLKGEHRLQGDLKGVGFVEWGFKTEKDDPNNSGLFNRYAYLGLKYNEVKAVFGRAPNPYQQVAAITDNFNIFGMSIYGEQKGNSVSSRYDDSLVLSYKSPNVDTEGGLDLRLAGGIGDASRQKGLSGQDNYYSFSAGWTMPLADSVKFSAVAAYQRQNFVFAADKDTAVGNKSKGDNHVIAGGLGFTFDNVYVGAAYSRKEADKAGTSTYAEASKHLGSTEDGAIEQFSGVSDSFDLFAKYTMNDKLEFAVGYAYENGDIKDSSGVVTSADQRITDSIIAGVNYNFNDHVNMYGEYLFDNRNKIGAGPDADNRWGVGATFRF